MECQHVTETNKHLRPNPKDLFLMGSLCLAFIDVGVANIKKNVESHNEYVCGIALEPGVTLPSR